jgi:hypothetical protein
MKYILGAIIGVAVMFGGHALAATRSDMQVVGYLDVNVSRVYKIVDTSNGTVCYFVIYGTGTGISCLKNN